MIKKGDQAPLDIIVRDQGGSDVSLRDLLGTYVVLYAYPMDETPGCIKEACSIRDVNEEFKTLGVKVVGISADDEASHQKFIEKHTLNFSLWADTKKELLTALGVQALLGTKRTTFLIDKDGKVAHIWENVKPEGHGEEVLDFVTQLVPK